MDLNQYDGILLMCRPDNPDHWPPNRKALWDQMIVEQGFEPFRYPGSITDQCSVCDITVLVGPRQQAAIAEKGRDKFIVLCPIDAVEAMIQLQENDDTEVAVHSLDNPYKPGGN